MADGNVTEMAAAMVEGNRNGNGGRQRRRRWAIAMATMTLMATATATELATVTEMATAMAMATAFGKGNHYKGRVASSCAGDVQRFWRGDTLPPPPWTQRKVHSPALRHGGDTAKSVCVCVCVSGLRLQMGYCNA